MCRIFSIFLLFAFPFQSSDSQWQKLGFPSRTAHTLLQTSQGLLAANEVTIYRSIDNGVTWDSLSTISDVGIEEMLQVGNILLVVSSRGVDGFVPPRASVFRSENFGRTLDSVQASVFGANSIEFLNGYTYNNLDALLFISPDTGKTWNRIDSGSALSGNVFQIVAGGNSLYILGDHALYRSDNGGLTWNRLSTPFSRSFYNLIVRDSSLYVGTFSEGFFSSTDRGLSWKNASDGLSDSSGFRALYLYENELVASISKDFQLSVYRYNLFEGIWHDFNEGFSLRRTRYIHSFANNSQFLFLGADSSLWRRPLADWITNVPVDLAEPSPGTFLYQNFPNPFNPTTRITFSLPKREFVVLQVFDILGREVDRLENGLMEAGVHTITFDGSRLGSGICIYRVKAGEFVSSKKMLLIK